VFKGAGCEAEENSKGRSAGHDWSAIGVAQLYELVFLGYRRVCGLRWAGGRMRVGARWQDSGD
jgi:hypothetical protein